MRAWTALLVMVATVSCTSARIRPQPAGPLVSWQPAPSWEAVAGAGSLFSRTPPTSTAPLLASNAAPVASVWRTELGMTFPAKTIEALEEVLGKPLERTLDRYFDDLYPDWDLLLQLRDQVPLRLPLAKDAARKALWQPAENLLRLVQRMRKEYEAAKVEGDETTYKEMRGEIWRVYQAGFAELRDIAFVAIADVLLEGAALGWPLPGPEPFARAEEAGVSKEDATAIFRLAGRLHVRRHAVAFLAPAAVDGVVNESCPAFAAALKF